MQKLRYIVFFAVLIQVQTGRAQQWLQNGDGWVYHVTTGWNFPNWGLHTLEVEGDTLINDTVWKKLVYRQINQGPEIFIAREEDGRVYHRERDWNGSYSSALVYDFNLRPDDTLCVTNQLWYKIIDTASIVVGNTSRRVQHIRFKNEGVALIAIEGIGLTGRAQDPTHENTCSFLLLSIPFCMGFVDGYSFYFRCFRSAQGDRYSPFSNDPCKALGVTAAEEQLGHLWPNPARDLLWVAGNYRMLRFFDVKGHLLSEVAAAVDGLTALTVGHLPRGMYFLAAYSATGAVVWRRRVVLVP